MSWLVDTAVLVRLANLSDPLHDQAVAAIARLWRQDEALYLAPQNLVEFWSVATRPVQANGLGLSPADTASILDVFEAEFIIAPETPALLPALRAVLRSVEVLGKQVHDARLVAFCHVHGLISLLTFNSRHFTRFSSMPPGLHVVEPASLVTSR
jgi:predicted nucleic acid-binding protein